MQGLRGIVPVSLDIHHAQLSAHNSGSRGVLVKQYRWLLVAVVKAVTDSKLGVSNFKVAHEETRRSVEEDDWEAVFGKTERSVNGSFACFVLTWFKWIYWDKTCR